MFFPKLVNPLVFLYTEQIVFSYISYSKYSLKKLMYHAKCIVKKRKKSHIKTNISSAPNGGGPYDPV